MGKTENWTELDFALQHLQNRLAVQAMNDLDAWMSAVTPPETVFHYTDLLGALATIQGGHLWFTERAHLNDTLEVRHGLEVCHEIFRAASQSSPAKLPSSMSDHLRGEFDLCLDYYGYWAASLSRVDDDLSQWRGYGDEGRGVCLGFTLANLEMAGFFSQVGGATSFLRFPIILRT